MIIKSLMFVSRADLGHLAALSQAAFKSAAGSILKCLSMSSLALSFNAPSVSSPLKSVKYFLKISDISMTPFMCAVLSLMISSGGLAVFVSCSASENAIWLARSSGQWKSLMIAQGVRGTLTISNLASIPCYIGILKRSPCTLWPLGQLWSLRDHPSTSRRVNLRSFS